LADNIRALFLGEDYQHRYFWIQAARLFMENEPASIVYLEHQIIRAFDDVVVVNSIPLYDAHNRLVETDHFQLKFHVDNRETITALDLIDPKFIGASTVSLLERAHAATQAGDIPKRLTLVTPWRIDQDDVLRKLVSNNDGEMVLSPLFVDGPKSAMGQVREAWRARLGGVDDDALQRVMRHLRIFDGVQLRHLNADVAAAFDRAGLEPPQESQLDDRYLGISRRG
jgi:hypothetical protein